LQQSVCVLPQRNDLQQQLENLKTEIVEGGGEANLLIVTIEDTEQNLRLFKQFQS